MKPTLSDPSHRKELTNECAVYPKNRKEKDQTKETDRVSIQPSPQRGRHETERPNTQNQKVPYYIPSANATHETDRSLIFTYIHKSIHAPSSLGHHSILAQTPRMHAV